MEKRMHFFDFLLPVSDVEDVTRACHEVKMKESHYVQAKVQFEAVSYDVVDEYMDNIDYITDKYI